MQFKHLAVAVAAAIPLVACAMGGAFVRKTAYEILGHLGEIVINPYEVAPLTAIIRNGGYEVQDVTVTILPKMNGESSVLPRLQAHAHDARRRSRIRLYPDYVNKVKVDYTRIFNGKAEKFCNTCHRSLRHADLCRSPTSTRHRSVRHAEGDAG